MAVTYGYNSTLAFANRLRLLALGGKKYAVPPSSTQKITTQSTTGWETKYPSTISIPGLPPINVAGISQLQQTAGGYYAGTEIPGYLYGPDETGQYYTVDQYGNKIYV